MPPSSPRKKAALVGVVVFLLLLVGGSFLLLREEEKVPVPEPLEEKPTQNYSVIGTSVEGRDIKVYTFGDGDKKLLFVGGVHGGYEWNSVLLAYQAMDYLSAHPEAVPKNLTVSIVPSANPDGVFAVVGKEGRFAAGDVPAGEHPEGRLNAHSVDLNRNFDCKWQPEGVWRGTPVSAGTAAFSEPEAGALRDFIIAEQPESVVFWHSKANAVYASECTGGILPGTYALMNTYARAAGYTAVDSFDAYEVTGDAEGWLASIGIPAITVELSTHENTEWEKNLAGIRAVFEHYAAL